MTRDKTTGSAPRHDDGAHRSAFEQALLLIIAAQERELKRAARALHDVVGQNLIALRMGLNALPKNAAGDEPSAPRQRELESMALETADNIQSLIFDLRPTVLDDLGLIAAVEDFVDNWSARHGIEANFQSASRTDLSLGKDRESCLFRIVQEALANAASHSGCDLAEVNFREQPGELWLIINDNGRGFDPVDVLEGPGQKGKLGIAEMQARAQLAGVHLTLDSETGVGTSVTIRIPLINQIERSD